MGKLIRCPECFSRRYESGKTVDLQITHDDIGRTISRRIVHDTGPYVWHYKCSVCGCRWDEWGEIEQHGRDFYAKESP